MDPIVNYFNGEKMQCSVGVAIAVVSIAVAAYFLYTQKPLLKGTAYTFLIISTLLLVVCVGVIARTQKDIARVTGFYQEQPNKIQSEELVRMEKVMKSFGILKKVEIGLVVIGMVLMIAFWGTDLIKGIALGLVIQGVIMYLFDHFAEARGAEYVDFLRSIPT